MKTFQIFRFAAALTIICLAWSACQKEELLISEASVNETETAQLKPETSPEDFLFICTAIPLEDQESRDPHEKAVASSDKYWGVGARLRVKFINGSAAQKAKVMQYAQQWEQYANLSFRQSNDRHSEIRIKFNNNSVNKSEIGSGSRSLGEEFLQTFGYDNPSMHLDITGESETRIRRVVLHEFGHAIGLQHEHQHPKNGIDWNKNAVYAAYAAYGWSRDDINKNIFKALSRSNTQYCAYDPNSIMHYDISAAWTNDGYSVNGSTNLSGMDKAFIQSRYPFQGRRGAVDCFGSCLVDHLEIVNEVDENEHYKTTFGLEANSKISAANVTYQAGNEVVFKPGFVVSASQDRQFRALIRNCGQ